MADNSEQPLYGYEALKAMGVDIRPTDKTRAVDKMFAEKARNALEESGMTPLEFLEAHPLLSNVGLAKELNRGANAVGLVSCVYEEAVRTNRVREVAKDLLTRQILSTFPNGWIEDENVAAGVKIGSWIRDIKTHANRADYSSFADAIWTELAIENAPPVGWKPESKNDPLLMELFDRHWPVTPAGTHSSTSH